MKPARFLAFFLLLALATLARLPSAYAADPLTGWQDGPSKKAIVAFVGKVDHALNEALQQGWTVASMSRDWKRVFTFQK